MRLSRTFILAGFIIMALSSQVKSQAQPDKKEAELKRLKDAVDAAQIKVNQNERKIDIADSLIRTGNQMIADAKAETKAIDADAKSTDKEYATNEKPLLKQSNSKNKDEATKAKADLKALDLKYKNDTKALDNRYKAADKKGTTGNNDITKGKTAKKTAEDALKISKANLDAATKKYEAALNAGETDTSKDKKK